jgi:hypothetical protein
VRLGVDLREQSPHTNHGFQLLLERTIGEIPDEVHGLLQRDRQVASPGGTPRHGASAIGAGSRETCSSSSDAAVEGVQLGELVSNDRMMPYR